MPARTVAAESSHAPSVADRTDARRATGVWAAMPCALIANRPGRPWWRPPGPRIECRPWKAPRQLTVRVALGQDRWRVSLGQEPLGGPGPVRRNDPDLLAQAVGHEIVTQPLDLVVDDVRLAEGVLPHRPEIEDVEVPDGGAAREGRDELLEGDTGAVGGEGGAFDVLVEDACGPVRDVALDQVGLVVRGQGRVERTVVARERHAPEVEVGRVEARAPSRHVELLEVGDRGAGCHVPDGRPRRELARRRIRVSRDERRRGAERAVAGDPR